MDVERFALHVEEVRRKIGEIHQSAGASFQRHPILDEAFAELATALEELSVAEEELRQQNDELLQTRVELETERQRYQDLFQFAPDGYLVTDASGIVREANYTAARLLNMSPKFVVGKPFSSFVAPVHRHEFRQQLNRVLQTDRVQGWVIPIQPRHGHPFDGSLTIAVDRDEDGQPVALRWLMRDVSELTRAEARIRELNVGLEHRVTERTSELEAARKRLAFLAEASAQLVASLDHEETLAALAWQMIPRFADSCAIDLIENGLLVRRGVAGAEPGPVEMDSGHGTALIDPEHDHPVARVLRTGQTVYYATVSDDEVEAIAWNPEHAELLRMSGTTSFICAPMTMRGRVLGAITCMMSVSGRHYAEADLRLIQEIASRAAQAVDNARLYDDAQTAIQARNEFLSVAAHELKTPVTSLQGFAQLTLRHLDQSREIDPDRLRHALTTIDHQSSKLAHLIAQLLDVSRIDAGRLTLDCTKFDISSLVQNVVTSQAPAHRDRIRIHMPERVIVMADPLRLEQVIINLVNNALKYSPEEEPVLIEIERLDRETVMIAVEDHGAGISPDEQRHIFDRFFQAHSRDQAGGMGLGLYISQQIIEMHGGHINVESPANGGSRFVVSLPASTDDITGEGNQR